MTDRILPFPSRPSPQATDEGRACVEIPMRLKWKASELITRADRVKRLLSGKFTTEAGLAEAKKLLEESL